MNTSKTSTSAIIIIVIIIVVALAAYFYYEGGNNTASSSLESVPAGTGSGEIGSRVLVLLNQIRDLKIDASLFSDPAFLALQDYSIQIPQQNVGRLNPFAPISGMRVASSTAGSSGTRR